MTVDEGWREMLRRNPDSAQAVAREKRQKYLRQMSRRIGQVAAVAACVAIACAVGWYFMVPQDLRTQPTTHLANQPASPTDSVPPSACVTTEDVQTAPWSWQAAAPARTPFAKLNYVAWREENREWFPDIQTPGLDKATGPVRTCES